MFGLLNPIKFQSPAMPCSYRQQTVVPTMFRRSSTGGSTLLSTHRCFKSFSLTCFCVFVDWHEAIDRRIEGGFLRPSADLNRFRPIY